MPSNDATKDVRHVKAARELLRWDQRRLAEAADLSLASVRRYEAARGGVAEGIERGIITALEMAGVVFVASGDHDDIPVSGGVLLRRGARPEPPLEKRIYVYTDALAGRPSGKKDGAKRKPRVTEKSGARDETKG